MRGQLLLRNPLNLEHTYLSRERERAYALHHGLITYCGEWYPPLKVNLHLHLQSYIKLYFTKRDLERRGIQYVSSAFLLPNFLIISLQDDMYEQPIQRFSMARRKYV